MGLPTPVGKQREVVALTTTGHVAVLGTAGSGKTTMAVHRAAFLGDTSTDHGGRTLLLTFNKALLAYLRHLGAGAQLNVDVLNYHAWARGYLASLGLMSFDDILQAPRETLIRESLAEARAAVAPTSPGARLSLAFVETEITYMQRHGLLDLADYKGADRVGRQTPLDAGRREFVFDVYRRYRGKRTEAGYRYDWPELAYHARVAAEADTREAMYRHIVIDEGQDFSPEMIRSLAAVLPEDGSLTFFGDVAQQIYGRGISFRSAGLNVHGRVLTFEKNYRNSPEIAALGLAIAAMPYYKDQPDMVAPTEFMASGPKPTLVRFDSWDAQASFVIEQAGRIADTQSVAILLRRHQDEAPYLQAFPSAQKLDRDLAIWNDEPGISIGTAHSAKGFEFDTVFIVGAHSGAWPDPMAVDAEGRDDAEAMDGRLLYVAVTRARRGLIVTVPGEPSDLLPIDDELWQVVQR